MGNKNYPARYLGPLTENTRLSRRPTQPGDANETHMHALTIAVDNKDSITSTWTLYDRGAKKNDVVVKLARTKI